MDRQHDATAAEVVTTPPETYAYPTTETHGTENRASQNDTPQILAELVIEEVSIDGMCGVY